MTWDYFEDALEVASGKFLEALVHREYIPRAARMLVTGALTINPVSIFSGNVACLGLKQGCSAETEPIFDLLSLAYQVAQFWSVF